MTCNVCGVFASRSVPQKTRVPCAWVKKQRASASCTRRTRSCRRGRWRRSASPPATRAGRHQARRGVLWRERAGGAWRTRGACSRRRTCCWSPARRGRCTPAAASSTARSRTARCTCCPAPPRNCGGGGRRAAPGGRWTHLPAAGGGARCAPRADGCTCWGDGRVREPRRRRGRLRSRHGYLGVPGAAPHGAGVDGRGGAGGARLRRGRARRADGAGPRLGRRGGVRPRRPPPCCTRAGCSPPCTRTAGRADTDPQKERGSPRRTRRTRRRRRFFVPSPLLSRSDA
jgi:hypothetical protein